MTLFKGPYGRLLLRSASPDQTSSSSSPGESDFFDAGPTASAAGRRHAAGRAGLSLARGGGSESEGEEEEEVRALWEVVVGRAPGGHVLWEVVVEIGLAEPDLFLFLPSESDPSAARNSGLGLDRRVEPGGGF